jgi:hypothetical protein
MRPWWNHSEGCSIANWDKSFAIWIFLRNEVEVETIGVILLSWLAIGALEGELARF